MSSSQPLGWTNTGDEVLRPWTLTQEGEDELVEVKDELQITIQDTSPTRAAGKIGFSALDGDIKEVSDLREAIDNASNELWNPNGTGIFVTDSLDIEDGDMLNDDDDHERIDIPIIPVNIDDALTPSHSPLSYIIKGKRKQLKKVENPANSLKSIQYEKKKGAAILHISSQKFAKMLHDDDMEKVVLNTTVSNQQA